MANSMSVRELKEYLTSRRINPVNVGLEKANLQRRVKEIMNSEISGSSAPNSEANGRARARHEPAGGAGAASAEPVGGAGAASAEPAGGVGAAAPAGELSLANVNGYGGIAALMNSDVRVYASNTVRAPLDRKVKLLYLGEEHSNTHCAIDSADRTLKFINKNRLYPKEICFASEGRLINPCFQGITNLLLQGRAHLPPPLFINEYTDLNFKADESILVLFLMAEVLFAIANGERISDPDGTPLNIMFFIKRLLNDDGREGPHAFYKAANVAKDVRTFIAASIATKPADALEAFKASINGIVTYLNTIPAAEWLVHSIITPFIESDYNLGMIKRIIGTLNLSRDITYINKVLTAVRENKNIKAIIIIRGDIHMTLTRAILKDVPWIEWDSASRSFTGRMHGGRRRTTRKSRRYRRTKNSRR